MKAPFFCANRRESGSSACGGNIFGDTLPGDTPGEGRPIFSDETMDSLHQAILDGRVPDVRTLVQQGTSLLTPPSTGRDTFLQLARNKGIMETIVVLLHANAPGTDSYGDYEDLLRAYLMEISQSWTAASWHSGIEFIIWSLAVGDEESFSFSEYHAPFSLAPEEKAEWLFLAERAKGWPTFEAFLPLDSWKKLYQAQRS